jgi:hypothetical protein
MQQIVIATIAKLVAQKKQPSVALVKAHLTQAVPMPVIIDVLARFKQNPDEFISEQQICETTTEQPQLNNDTQLDRIEKKLDQLLSLLKDHT